MKNKRKKRKVDYKAEKIFGFLGKSFALVENRQIKTWKAMSIIAFVAGIVGAVIWIDATDIHLGSKAAGETAYLSLSPSSNTVHRGESFDLDVLLNTNNNNVVAVRAIVIYDNRYFTLTGWDTDDSALSSNNSCVYDSKPCEIVGESVNGDTSEISIVLAKPSPGVVTSSGKVATLSFTATEDAVSDSISIEFDGVRDYADSDIIFDGIGDDGAGTDILASVTNTQILIEDPDAPIMSDLSPSGTLASGTTSVTLSLTTNVSATCKYSTTGGVAYDSMTNTFSTTGGTSHSQNISGLTDQAYDYYVRCSDSEGNENISDYMISFVIGDNNPVYRFYSQNIRSHFFTISATEKNRIISTYPETEWRYEGIAYYVPATSSGNSPVYRFYSQNNRSHFFTISASEKNNIIATYPEEEWRYEGIAYYVPE